MTAVAVLVIFAGYAVLSYGFILLKGYDISWKQWIDPLAPYAWPSSGSPGTVPSGQVLP